MKEKTTDKRPYEVPQLTVVTFKAERGYAVSGTDAKRSGYGNANTGVDGGQTDGNGNWVWD